MEWSAVIQTGLGIVISVGLFLLGYRKTIGAKRERVRSANDSIHRALLRRMVLEEYQPRIPDIRRFIEGKAQEHGVEAELLLPPEQVLQRLFSAVFDSDLIDPTKRAELERRLEAAFTELQAPETGGGVTTGTLGARTQRTRETILVLAVLTSAAGAASVLLPTFAEQAQPSSELWAAVAGVFIASLAAALGISYTRRLRDLSRETSAVDAVRERVDLERSILRAVKKLGGKVEALAGRPGFGDLLIEIGGRKLLVETRVARGFVPLGHLRTIAGGLQGQAPRRGADLAAIVLSDGARIDSDMAQALEIPVVRISEFEAFLKKWRGNQ